MPQIYVVEGVGYFEVRSFPVKKERSTVLWWEYVNTI